MLGVLTKDSMKENTTAAKTGQQQKEERELELREKMG